MMRALVILRMAGVLGLAASAGGFAGGSAGGRAGGSTDGSAIGTAARPLPAAAAVTYSWPVAAPARVVRGFDPPATRYGAGHLGVDLAVRQGEPVLAAAAGTVSFAGPVAGRGVVVIGHADGVSTEYEPVRSAVAVGDEVERGTDIGSVSGEHAGCPVTSCLHWGARRGDSYIDPLSLLAPLGPVRLLPWHG